MKTIIFFLMISIIMQGILVVWSSNPITSVLYLISVYISCSFLFLILGAEFVAILLVLIYVGAVAMLFIFVVMMLNQRIVETYNSLINYLPLGLAIGFCFFIEMIYMIKSDFGFFNCYKNAPQVIIKNFSSVTNIDIFAKVLYNDYSCYIYICGLLLLLAMIGAIALTLPLQKKIFWSNKVYPKQRLEDRISNWRRYG